MGKTEQKDQEIWDTKGDNERERVVRKRFGNRYINGHPNLIF